MSKRIELVPSTKSTWKIVMGRKSYGVVIKRESGICRAVWRIKNGENLTAEGNTVEAAFDAICEARNLWYAKTQGFSSVADLDQKNREVRAENRQMKKESRARAQEIVGGMLGDDDEKRFAAYEKLFKMTD